MIIISTFEQTLEVEEALAVVESMGIDPSSILVVPMELYFKDTKRLMLRAEDINARAFEVGMACATAMGVIGASLGFALKWGPILWGVVYTVIGFFIGFGGVLYYKVIKGERALTRSPRRPKPEVAVIIQCAERQSSEIRQVLWQYRAISVGDAMR